jgi:predicted dinucleotide-binding enzyme
MPGADRPAERIAVIVDVLAPDARAVSTDEVVRHADLIVLAVPTTAFESSRAIC